MSAFTSLGAVRRNRFKTFAASQRAYGGRKIKLTALTWRTGTTRGRELYSAVVCAGPGVKAIGYGPLGYHKRCGKPGSGSTPTAALKHALHALARSLR